MVKPEKKARETIDQQLRAGGWAIQEKKRINLFEKTGAAVRGLEESLKAGKQRALLQMATISGKTYTAMTGAKRRKCLMRPEEILKCVQVFKECIFKGNFPEKSGEWILKSHLFV